MHALPVGLGPSTRTLVAAVAVSFASVAGFAAAPAQAADLAVCAGADHVAFDPGLTFTPKTVDVHSEDEFTCASNEPGAASGVITDHFAYPGASCLGIPGLSQDGGAFTLVVRWSDAVTSTWSVTSSTESAVAGQIVTTSSGTITAGRFAGATATAVTTDVTPSVLQCLGSGVTRVDGALALTIVAA